MASCACPDETLQMTLIAFAEIERYPKFHNEVGVSIVRIGCREFECIGDRPPQDRKRPTIHVCDIIVADDMFAL
jgi:hypothetical protein